jgi:hypothetical protein
MYHCLLNIKEPIWFAKRDLYGVGEPDANPTEVGILSHSLIAVNVTIYDNGRWEIDSEDDIHQTPFMGTLIYIPGVLLTNEMGQIPRDLLKVTKPDSRHTVNEDMLLAEYLERIRPGLEHANQVCREMDKMGFITIPGLGCGAFSEGFQGLHGLLRNVIERILSNHHGHLPHIKAVYYDPHEMSEENQNFRCEIGHITYLVRPLLRGNENKPQLCHPSAYQEPGDDFSDCHLISFVAWDPVSWPGNDYWGGVRFTDDGVKAAASSTMYAMTGIKGEYDCENTRYMPPAGYTNWNDVVEQNSLEIHITPENVRFY